jgi:hypothetical protein
MTVNRHLGRHNRQVFARLEKRSAAVKVKQVQQLEWMAEESTRAWEKTGHPAHLGTARGALSDVRKILALEPKPVEAPSGFNLADFARQLEQEASRDKAEDEAGAGTR